jgi:hypothetical protein
MNIKFQVFDVRFFHRQLKGGRRASEKRMKYKKMEIKADALRCMSVYSTLNRKELLLFYLVVNVIRCK